MDPHRQHLIEAISSLNQRAEALFDQHTREELLWKPEPKAWSMTQCIEHLTTSLRLYLPPFEVAVSSDGPRGEGPYRYGLIARLWIQLLRPGGPKMPSPKQMRPRRQEYKGTEPSGLDPQRVHQDFTEAHHRLADLVRASEGLDLEAIRMRSPVIPILRFPLGAWFETCVQHGRRHMAQAEGVAARLASSNGEDGKGGDPQTRG